jgi:hypothetical protein
VEAVEILESNTENVRMWTGGPLRQMASTKVSSTFIPHARTIENCSFVGRYVCDGCQEPSKGVYRQEYSKPSSNRTPAQGSDIENGGITWVCDTCKGGRVRVIRTPEEKEAQRSALVSRLTLARQAHAGAV